MKRGLMVVLAAIAVLLFSMPSAFARRIIFDPPPPSGVGSGVPSARCTNDQPCNVFDQGVAYQNTWVPCSDLPSYAFKGVTGLTQCLWFNNVSGAPLNTFTFSMNPTSEDAGQGLTCEVSPSTLVATVGCPNTIGAAGDLLTVSFSMSPGLPISTDFFLGTDFEGQPTDPSATVASVPEPDALGMFGLGLLAIAAVYGWDRRRRVIGAKQS